MVARVIAVWMILITGAGICAAAEPDGESPSARTNGQIRSLSAIQTDVHAALCAEATTRRMGKNRLQVVRLITLYREISAHPQRDESALLAQLGLQLRTRLEKIRDQIKRQNANSDRLKKPASDVLAQQIAVQGGAAVGQGAPAAGTAVGAAGQLDYGPDLVELIQQTISSDIWDINGGNSAVVYFAPLHVLVVSAPAGVHEQIGGVLVQLRANP